MDGKQILGVLASTLAMFAATAADVEWNGDGPYNLGADDTLTFSSNETITEASSFTGNGTIIVASGTVTLDYKITKTPFAGFTGTIKIDGGATVDANSSQGFDEDGSHAMSVFGPSAKIAFNGGTLRGFKGQNNTQITGAVAVNADSKLTNDSANSLPGVNLRIRNTVSFTGAYTLEVESQARWVEFAQGVDFTGFTGGITLSGGSSEEAVLYGTDYGASATWTFDANRDFRIAPGAGQTVGFGALTAGKGNIKIGDDSVTLEVGRKTGSASSIAVPFTDKAFTLKKVGADSALKLGAKVAFVDGSTLDVDEGLVEFDGVDLSSSVTLKFAPVSTQKVTAAGAAIPSGTAFGTLEIENDGMLTIPAGDWADGATVTLFTYDSTMPIDVSRVSVSGLKGNSSAVITDDNGTVKATLSIPTLVWNGEQTNWTDANAWSVGETKCMYADGDKVSFADDATVVISGDIEPLSINNEGVLTISGSGSIAASISGAGSTLVGGTGTVRLLGALEQPLCINEGATASIAAQELTNVGKSNPPKITGKGTLLLDNGNVKVTHQEGKTNGKIYNLFYDFEGDIKLASGGFMEYLPVSTDGNTEEIPGAFGKGRIVFAGGGMRGFSGWKTRNSIAIANDIVVEEGTFSAITNNAARNLNGCHVYFQGKFTGKGVLEVHHANWDNRFVHFGGDLSEFAGTINNVGGGVDKITSSRSSGEMMRWDMNQQHQLRLEQEAGSTLKIGALNYPRNNASLAVSNSGTTIEIGGRNEDCAIECPFTGNAFALKKKGSAKLTLGSSVTMVADSTVAVDAGTLVVNAADLGADVAVGANGVLAGTGKVKSVTFAKGAAVDALPETPDTKQTYDIVTAADKPTWTTRPSVVNWTGKGKWIVRKRDNGDGTWTLYAAFAPHGLVIVVL